MGQGRPRGVTLAELIASRPADAGGRRQRRTVQEEIDRRNGITRPYVTPEQEAFAVAAMRRIAASLPPHRPSLDQGPDNKGGQAVSSGLTPTTFDSAGSLGGCVHNGTG